jgi:hypothetical protein
MVITFQQLATAWTWRPIPNCPGRFVLAHEGQALLSPKDLAGADTMFSTFHVSTARDAVVVGQFDGGGLISYHRRDGTFVHTLNTSDGFARKLQQLGIVLTTVTDH